MKILEGKSISRNEKPGTMNKKATLILIFGITILCGCNLSPKAEITDVQKERIIKEIELVWKASIEGIEQRDVQKAFKSFSKKGSAKYLRDGYLYESIEAAKKQYADWFANSPGKATLTFNPTTHDVLTEEIVITTALGKHVFIDSSDSQRITIVGYSIVWQKEEGSWKILNMHSSIK
ncbi:MAG: nuclear transport factor 2 family protein [Bacteroidota bacterium]